MVLLLGDVIYIGVVCNIAFMFNFILGVLMLTCGVAPLYAGKQSLDCWEGFDPSKVKNEGEPF